MPPPVNGNDNSRERETQTAPPARSPASVSTEPISLAPRRNFGEGRAAPPAASQPATSTVVLFSLAYPRNLLFFGRSQEEMADPNVVQDILNSTM